VVAVGGGRLAIGRLADRLDETEGVVAHGGEHLLGRSLLEARPAPAVLRGGDDGILDRGLEAGGLVFLERVEFVEPLDEQQVGELLDDRERIGDAARTQRVPDAVDFGFDFASDHSMHRVLAARRAGVEVGLSEVTDFSRAEGDGHSRRHGSTKGEVF
jgi:hypothetical protein